MGMTTERGGATGPRPTRLQVSTELCHDGAMTTATAKSATTSLDDLRALAERIAEAKPLSGQRKTLLRTLWATGRYTLPELAEAGGVSVEWVSQVLDRPHAGKARARRGGE